MSKQKFKVGDRVRIVKASVGVSSVGFIGEIDTIDPTDCRLPYLVEIECAGYRPKIWCYEVELIKKKHPVIVITTDGKTTTATEREGKTVIKTATATCSEKDTFSFDEGARIAFERLQGRDPFKASKDKPQPTKLVCVDNKIGIAGFVEGNVYEIKWRTNASFDFAGMFYSGEFVGGKYVAPFSRGDVEFIPLVED